jgi:hypothetical protein
MLLDDMPPDECTDQWGPAVTMIMEHSDFPNEQIVMVKITSLTMTILPL